MLVADCTDFIHFLQQFPFPPGVLSICLFTTRMPRYPIPNAGYPGFHPNARIRRQIDPYTSRTWERFTTLVPPSSSSSSCKSISSINGRDDLLLVAALDGKKVTLGNDFSDKAELRRISAKDYPGLVQGLKDFQARSKNPKVIS